MHPKEKRHAHADGSKPRPTIAMFINWLTGMHEPQWLGVKDAAREHGANLICFSGKELGHPDHFYSRASAVFDLVSPSHIDGLIVWTATLQHFVGPEKMEAFCRRFEPLPMVSVEQAMPRMRCVLMDEQRGMREVVSHLIERHGHRRIAFVRGPANHPGAGLRYAGYLQALTEHGLAVDPALMTEPLPYWMPEHAAEAAQALLDRRGSRIDAIAAANDDLALGVVWALQRRGLSVPADIAVVGFDDSINIQRPDLGMDSLRGDVVEVPHLYSSATVTVPLTTARAPTYQLGWRAVETLLAQLRGEEVPEQIDIPAPLVLRRSCGCLPGPNPRASDTLDERAAPLLEHVIEASKGASADPYLHTLDECVRATVSTQAELARWWPVLATVRGLAQEHGAQAADAAAYEARLETLWQRTQTLMWEWAARLHDYELALAGKREQIVRQIGQKLITTLDLAQMAQVLVDELPAIGLSSCYMALYEPSPTLPGDAPEPLPTALSRAVLVYDHGVRVDLSPGGELFASRQLVPGGLDPTGDPRSLVVLPLYSQDSQLGFVALEGGLRDGWVYEALRAQLSSAVQGARLVERERQALTEAEQARARAEVASQAKSDFLATMSHELRTPLNAILGYAQILQMAEGLSVRQINGLQTIQSSGEHLLALINDILDLAKIDATRLGLDPSAVPMRSFMRVIADIIRVKCEEKDLLFECETAALPAVVQVDEKRLRQVLLNLLSNAVKFTDRGTVSLRVRGHAERGGNVRLRFEVADTGIGISPQDTETIFQAFEQVGDRRRRAGGTGLGLAISRQLVRLMGSDIAVHSEPGKGSTFSFELSVPVDEEHAVPVRRHAAGHIAGYHGPRKRLLVVDDIEANRILLDQYLTPLGFVVEHACSGAEAVERVREATPDLVLMDIVMPVMDGVEATRRIRSMRDLPQPPILAVSANASLDNRSRCLAAGVSAFIYKPVSRDVLLKEVGTQLKLEWTETPL